MATRYAARYGYRITQAMTRREAVARLVAEIPYSREGDEVRLVKFDDSQTDTGDIHPSYYRTVKISAREYAESYQYRDND